MLRNTPRKLLFFIPLLLSGCSEPANSAPTANTAVVTMGFHSYKPDTVTIQKGQTIEWQNTAPLVTHTVTADSFNSGDMTSGKTWQHRFDNPGTYRYYCTHHEGMTGTVIVE